MSVKSKFGDSLIVAFIITIIAGLFFPLIWFLSALLFFAIGLLGESIDEFESLLDKHFDSLIQGNRVTVKDIKWHTIKGLTNLSKVLKHDDGYIELIYLYEDVNIPIHVKAKRYWLRKSKCDVTLSTIKLNQVGLR